MVTVESTTGHFTPFITDLRSATGAHAYPMMRYVGSNSRSKKPAAHKYHEHPFSGCSCTILEVTVTRYRRGPKDPVIIIVQGGTPSLCYLTLVTSYTDCDYLHLNEI